MNSPFIFLLLFPLLLDMAIKTVIVLAFIFDEETKYEVNSNIATKIKVLTHLLVFLFPYSYLIFVVWMQIEKFQDYWRSLE